MAKQDHQQHGQPEVGHGHAQAAPGGDDAVGPRPGRSPATMPAGSPISTATTMPPTAMLSVTGNRSRMPSATFDWDAAA